MELACSSKACLKLVWVVFSVLKCFDSLVSDEKVLPIPFLGFPRFLALLGWTFFHRSRLIVVLVKRFLVFGRGPVSCAPSTESWSVTSYPTLPPQLSAHLLFVHRCVALV